MLEAQALRVAAGGRVLVEGLELVVRRGEAWALVGPNGSGKTTLLHALAGVAPPAAGRVLLGGLPYTGRPPGEAACLRGLLPQALVDSFPASVLETVLVGRHPHLSRWAWEAADDVAVAQAALAAMDLAGLGARDVTTLSGGERQRVALAALLAQDPLLLLLDEPLAHLDPHHQMTVLRVLRERVDTQGRALVFSVHDLHLAARFATHALVIGPQGHCAGPADEVLDEATLAGAFGHAIRRVRAGGQWLFVPA